jgi:hypothetical protein
MTGSNTVLKVGDKVQVAKQVDRNGQLCPPDDYLGAMGTVTANDADGIWVKFDRKLSLPFCPDQLSFVSPQ